MQEEDKKKLYHIFLVLIGTFVIADLVFLNIVFLLNPQDKIISPVSVISSKEISKMQKQAAVEKPAINDDAYYRAICRDELTKALATISAKPKEAVKTVYQQVSSPKQASILYIPLGGSVATSNRDWSYVGGAEGYFDKSNYPGAKKITWEAFLKIGSGNGEANARLYDNTNKVVISSSEIRGGGNSLSLVSSLALNLIDGNNHYQVQLRSSTGYEALMEGARFKVEY